MNRSSMNRSSSLLALGMLLSVVLACSSGGENAANTGAAGGAANSSAANTSAAPAKSGVQVKEVWLAKDDGSGDDGEKVTGFKPTDGALHCVALLSEFESGTKVKVEWIVVNAGGEQNLKILEKEMTTNMATNTVDFKATLPNPWPVGDYRANVYVNGNLDKSVDFKIQ